MSSDNPPYPYYNGIPFNPSFFTSDTGSGLTEAQANAKYLQKTVPDTASALETFNGGIVAPSLSSTGSLDIVMPNALASNVLNVGVVSRNISGQVHHYSDGDGCVAGANVHLNNGINNASNTNIANGTTTTGQVNIMTGASSTGTTTIGTSGTTIGINGATTITGTTSIVGTTNINTSNGLNTTIGTVTTGTTSLRGATISLTNVNTVNIGTSPPSDNTRQVNIGGVNGANTSLISTFGRVTVVGVTNINTSGTNNTSIGVAGSTTSILGTTNINTTGTSATTIGNVSNTLTINGSIIKHIVPCLGGGNIENVLGNANNLLSLSTTFNRKFTTSLATIPCYTIVSPGNYATQYFEIVISGANNNRGGYTYKGCFGIQTGAGVTVSAVTQLFYFGVNTAPVITFTIVSLTVTVSINTSAGSTDQCFVSTITSYPALQLDNGSSDYSITAS